MSLTSPPLFCPLSLSFAQSFMGPSVFVPSVNVSAPAASLSVAATPNSVYLAPTANAQVVSVTGNSRFLVCLRSLLTNASSVR